MESMGPSMMSPPPSGGGSPSPTSSPGGGGGGSAPKIPGMDMMDMLKKPPGPGEGSSSNDDDEEKRNADATAAAAVTKVVEETQKQVIEGVQKAFSVLMMSGGAPDKLMTPSKDGDKAQASSQGNKSNAPQSPDSGQDNDEKKKQAMQVGQMMMMN